MFNWREVIGHSQSSLICGDDIVTARADIFSNVGEQHHNRTIITASTLRRIAAMTPNGEISIVP